MALTLFMLSKVSVDGREDGNCQPPEDELSFPLLSSQISVMDVNPSKKSAGMVSKLLSSR